MKIYINSRALIEREIDGSYYIAIQTRVKTGEQEKIEFPGGQIELYESIEEALRREIREETGLKLTEIIGNHNRSEYQDGARRVECITPTFAYQTLEGPIDSIGYFFVCRAEGEFTQKGDAAEKHRWIKVSDLASLVEDSPETFNWLTLAAAKHYIKFHSGR